MAYGQLKIPEKLQVGLWLVMLALVFASAIYSTVNLSLAQDKIKMLEYTLSEKSFWVRKAQVTSQKKRCEALQESTNGYHAGNWRIEVSDKGVTVHCIQQGYKIHR
jgi:hypothetical protein